MPTEVIMPKVDMDMAAGVIAAWHVGDGERVEKGAPLFDIETDKAAMEVEAPASGTVRRVTAETGAEVAIGAAVAWIYADGEEPARTLPGAAPPAVAPAKADVTAAAASRGGGADGAGIAHAAEESVGATVDRGGKLRATPVARRLAEREGIALGDIAGSGPRGRVQREDVRRHLEAVRAGSPALDAEAPAVPTPAAEAPAPSAPARQDLRAPSGEHDRPGAVSRAGSTARTPFGGASAARPIVTVHGFAGDAASWEPLRKRLRTGRALHHVELANHGRGARRRIADFADLVGEALATFDALGVDGCHLVGHSLGGAVALAIADRRPEAMASLTLLCPAGFGPEIDARVLAGIAAAARPQSLAPWLKTLVADPDAISWSYVEAAAAQRADRALRDAQAAMADALFPDGTQAFDVVPLLPRVACPVRIVWGRRDRIIPWRHALRAPGRVALHLFDGVGHLPQLEAADELAGLLADRG